MEKLLNGKLNSKGLIKSLETYRDPVTYYTNEVRLIIDTKDKAKISEDFSDINSFNGWLRSITELDNNEWPDISYEVIDNNDNTSTIIMMLNPIHGRDFNPPEKFIGALVEYVSADKVIPTLCKVGVYIDSAEIHADLLSTSLILDMGLDVYMKYVDVHDEEPELLLFSQENLEKVLKSLVSNSGIEVPEIMSLDDTVTTDKITIQYDFHPGQHDSELIEIFNYLTVDDFDDESDRAEDMFMDINDINSVAFDNFEVENESTESNDTMDGMKVIIEMFKTLKMDMDMEMEEMIIDHDEDYGKSSKTKITIKGFKLSGRMNK